MRRLGLNSDRRRSCGSLSSAAAGPPQAPGVRRSLCLFCRRGAALHQLAAHLHQAGGGSGGSSSRGSGRSWALQDSLGSLAMHPRGLWHHQGAGAVLLAHLNLNTLASRQAGQQPWTHHSEGLVQGCGEVDPGDAVIKRHDAPLVCRAEVKGRGGSKRCCAAMKRCCAAHAAHHSKSCPWMGDGCCTAASHYCCVWV